MRFFPLSHMKQIGLKPFLTILAIVIASIYFISLSKAKADETVKAGLLLPYAGVYASLGNAIENGFRLAVDEAGMADKIDIVREDTEVKPPVGLAKARKLVLEDEVDVIVGLVSSGVLGAVRDFIHDAKTPLIVANAGNNLATGERCSPYIMRVSFSNAQINRPMGPWLYEQGVRKIYTLAPDYAAGRQMIDAFAQSFTASGGEIIGQDYSPFRKTNDFGPYLTKAASSNADGIFAFYSGSEAVSFVKQYGALGINQQIKLYGSGFLTSPLYVEAQGDAAVGVTTALHYIPTLDTPENQDFVSAYQTRFGETPSEFSMQGYDAGRILVEAMKTGATTREDLAKALPKAQYVGPRGPLEIDPKTNNVVQNIYIYETIRDAEGNLTQNLLDQVNGVRDEPNGCSL